ncbi:RNA-directed DNA polymerase, eukaryota [Tanacetum coccineum]
MNFPDNTTSKDLWEVCKGYGTVVDVFIPDRKSKAGKRERIVWIDIEGVPLHAWSRPTFSKIGSRWGEVIELEDNKEDCFARKHNRKCDYFWDDSVNGAKELNGDISKQMNLDGESDIKGVSDTVYDDKADSLGHEHTQNLVQGGILCAWDPSVFRKEHHVVSDNLLLYMGSWVFYSGEGNCGVILPSGLSLASVRYGATFCPLSAVGMVIVWCFVDGEWVDDPCRVKEEFRLHFANRFRAPAANRYIIFPGPDGFTFEFFRKFWDTLGSDFCAAVEWFFDHSSFSRGCNSSFIALIPKNHDPKFVNDYRPISLIGSLYKVVTKILATRLSSIISGLISDVQTAFLPNRQILDGPFIINELLSWCKHKKQQAMVFKVDFAKAYDSIRWDFLEDVLRAFGFGSKWCSWIRGCLHSGMASVLLNGSPTSEFQFHCGLKQGDPLAPYLFILIMESLHLSLSRAIEAGIFKGIKIGSSLNISHLFYADDAVFIGEWSIANLSGITYILHCFSLLSGLSINLKKSHLLGVGIRSEDVNAAALYFGCSTMKTPFKYLGVMEDSSALVLLVADWLRISSARMLAGEIYHGCPNMEKYFKRKTPCTSTSDDVTKQAAKEKPKQLIDVIDLNNLPWDPVDRPRISQYNPTGRIRSLKDQIRDIDILVDQGGVTDDMLLSRLDLSKQLHDLSSLDHSDFIQKAKVRWAVEGDENSKFFHGIINRKRTNLSVKGIMVDGEWVDDPSHIKKEFHTHFADRFKEPGLSRGKLNFFFHNRLCREQADDLELMVSNDEIRKAVWGCGENKSPGPDGYTFEFFRKFWTTIGPDFCSAVQWFFEHGAFAAGCNSSFVTLIPKILNPKLVSDFRPISLIGSIYKVITKILASRLSNVISDLISNVQTAFLPNRQILDGPFIVNEIISRCKIKNKKAMIFMVDFAKAYDSIRWDYLDDVLIAFGFGRKWCSWIQASLRSGKASILVNGSPSSEFHLHRGLKQGDPLAPFLFILIMESFHLSFSRAVEAGIFNGFRIDNSLMVSHLFYADDAIFIGEWSNGNLKGILNILSCFSMLSGMLINLKKSQILGVGISEPVVAMAAKDLGCSVMKISFLYLGVMVGGNMSLAEAWDSTIEKLSMRLSKWKLKTLSIRGRLTLLKSVLGSSPIYNMSLFKVPKSILNKMENLRRNFFNGAQEGDRKIAWVKWHTILAAKQFGGLGVSSFFALNRGLLAKWVWRFLSQDNSLWYQVISTIHGSGSSPLAAAYPSNWSTIIKEFNSLKEQGVDIFSHCKIRIGNRQSTRFWKDRWIDDHSLLGKFPRLYALETNKDISVADKLHPSLSFSWRRSVRGGIESQQFNHLSSLLDSVS